MLVLVVRLVVSLAVFGLGVLPPAVSSLSAQPASSPAAIAPVPADRRWLPPVHGEVIDFFRAPPTPYGPGNRGLEFGVVAGNPITAVASGVVSFAGPVAGTFHIVIDHADGLRSGYSHLSNMVVDSGDLVVAGQTLGSSSGQFHLSARLAVDYAGPDVPVFGARRYIDPLPLFGLKLTVRLVQNP